MDPIRKIPKKLTKKFGNKVINRQYFCRKTGLQSVCHCFSHAKSLLTSTVYYHYATDGRKVNCCAMKILLAPQSHKAFLFHFVLFYFCKVAFLCDLWYLRNASYGMPFTLQLYYYRPFTPRTLLSGFCPYFIFGLNDYLID